MRNTRTLTQCLAGLAFACGPMMPPFTQAEEKTILVDTAYDASLTSTWSAEGATKTGRFKAQEFITGDHGIVSSVGVRLKVTKTAKISAASGVLNVEIWDANEGMPGSKVGSLGEVDIRSLPSTANGKLVTFEGPIVGLRPNSAYYVVLDYIDSKAFVKREHPGGLDDPIERAESVSWLVAETLGNNGAPAPLIHGGFVTTEQPAIPDGMYSLPSEEDYTWEELPYKGKDLAGMMTVTESVADIPIPEISSFQHSKDTCSVVWKSLPFVSYGLEQSVDLSVWEPIPDADLYEDGNGVSTFTAPRLAGPDRFYRVRVLPPPPLLAADFEEGVGGWTVQTAAGDTHWELGTLNVDGLFGPGDPSGNKAWGTGIDRTFGPGTETALRSPLIDLTVTAKPELSFRYFIDSPEELGGGQLRILSGDGSVLFTLKEIFSGSTETWTLFNLMIPEEARNQEVILEFRFLSDETETSGAGWYIDDVFVD